MTSLSEVYERGRRDAPPRRLYLGVALFLSGAALTVVGIVVGTSSEVAAWLGLGVFPARETAGVLAGVGIPAALLGVITVLPQVSTRLRAAGIGGAVVALVGVGLFVWAYPQQWYTGQPAYAMPVTAVYFLGGVTTLWSMFAAVANFKTRNKPGGTVRFEITKGGETRVVEVSNDNLRQRLSGIGFLGGTPDGDAETQTAGRESAGLAGHAGGETVHPTASDGGAAATTDDAEFLDEPRGPQQDVYCGNCDHFRYVRTRDGGMQPYCGVHEEVMDDMEPCDRWEPNTN